MSYKASQTELVPGGCDIPAAFQKHAGVSDQDLEPGGGTERRGVQVLREGCFVGGNGADS